MIVAAGATSRHREYIAGECDFDLYLLVYDDSTDKWKGDTKYICKMHGYKLRMTYAYLTEHPEILERYDYFLLVDDDISMTSDDANAIFRAMREYKLEIAQPALVDSYYSWVHTLHDDFCSIRYTDFVEMMIPCFSREALRTVLFTFNESECGWGSEAHWPLLIKSNHRDMAIIDEVTVVHTRPVQSGTPQNFRDLDAYLKKYNLIAAAHEYGYLDAEGAEKPIFCRDVYNNLKNGLVRWAAGRNEPVEEMGLDGRFGYALLFALLSQITHARKFMDIAVGIADRNRHVGSVKHDLSLRHGITGCCYAMECMCTQDGTDAADVVLDEVDRYITERLTTDKAALTDEELVSVGLYFQKKYDRAPSAACKEICRSVAEAVSGREISLKSVNDMYIACGAADLMRRWGYRNDELVGRIKEYFESADTGSLDRLNIMWLLYGLTSEQSYLERLRHLANMEVFEAGSVRDALLLANLLTIRV